MQVYALYTDNKYVGFGFADNVAEETAGYDHAIVTIVDIASTQDETVARNLVDYFTHLIGPAPYKTMTQCGITADDQYTLSARAQADFDVQTD